MNYFSHYYFDHLPGEETHNFGLSLPDFVRNFVRGARLKSINPEDHKNTDYPLLILGTIKHFERDKKFHGSDFFQSTEERLNRVLKPVFESQDIRRYWFASHLMAEMVLDRVLMKQQPALLDQFYTDLDMADTEAIKDFLSTKGVSDLNVFEDRVNRFKTSQYLRQYLHDPALIYSLNRIFIFTKAGEEWTEEQYSELQKTIPEIEGIIFEKTNDLIEEMK